MLPAHRPPPPRFDLPDGTGEDLTVLGSGARRDADDIAFAGILDVERDIIVHRANIAWRERHQAIRAGRWVTSRIIYTAAVAASLIGCALWFRYTDDGRISRISFTESESSHAGNAGSPWDEPPWYVADMNREQITALSKRAAIEHLRTEAKWVR